MGTSGSGKSYLEKKLVKNHNCQKIVSSTTRDKRVGEIEGVDYHFLSRDVFDKRSDAGEFIQEVEFAGNKYSSAYVDYSGDKDLVLVVTPKAAKKLSDDLKSNSIDLEHIFIYFDISEYRIRKNI